MKRVFDFIKNLFSKSNRVMKREELNEEQVELCKNIFRENEEATDILFIARNAVLSRKELFKGE